MPSGRETASARARQLLELATKQRQLLGRVLWVTVVLLCVLGCLSQVFIFLEIFWKFPTIIEVETERTDDLDFPGVTICNNNRVRLSQLCRLRGETNCVQTKHRGGTENLDAMLRTMNKSLRGEIGHQKGTMIFETSKVVNGTVEVADDQGFRDEFFHLRYSNCYSYNVEWTGSGLKEAEIARQIDLSVILFLEQQEYPRSDVWPGAQIVFHDPEVIPDPEVDGIPLRAGHNYIFTLRQMITKRLPKPYWTKCVNYPFVRREQYVMKMTKPLCEKECAYNASLLMCRCIRVDVALPYEVDWDRQPSGKRRFCDADIALTRCWVKVLDETDRCQKKFCRRACLESQFETSVTQDPWPDEILFMQERERYSRLNITTVREARMNLTRIYLIYGTLNKITYRHRAKYEQIELFSYLGGFIGIWIGVSFLNVLEYGTQATTWLYHKYKERKSRRLQDSDRLKVKPISVRPTNGFPAEHW
ncbi:bile acid-sensitive ion channel-like isoform X1 [Dermacentor variabilis]|uniref:bile acid-sensitive ion channel-like isoform X1 n=1 Tax=Dermacentor variabilis TaxID=34621 RepID=UPI003F5C727D